MTGGEPATITVSKLTVVKELKRMVTDKLEVEPEHQILFFLGQKMEGDCTMEEYSVRANSKIMLIIRKPISSPDHLPKKGKSTEGGGPVVSSSRPNGRARPKTEQTESGSRKQEARSKRTGGESPAPRARANEDSMDDLLGDSQDEEDTQASDKEEGKGGPRATNGDGQRDNPSKEARKEEGPVKEKSENKAGHRERPGGQPGNRKEGIEQKDRPTNVDQSSAM